MNPITKAVRAYEAGGVKALDVGHPRPTGSTWWMSRAGFMRQLSDVGDGSSNSVVLASLNVLTNAFSEAPIQVVATQPDGQVEAIPDHPLVDLIKRPNPYMTASLLWQYYIWSSRVDGNSYFYKVRNSVGMPVELWPLNPDLVTPKSNDNDPTELISYYSYRPRGVEQRIAPEDIVHLRIALDPNDHRLGLAPLKVVLKQILGDEEASKFSTALLANMAVPGVVLTPSGEGGPSVVEAKAIKDTWTQRFGKDRRGEPLVMEGPMNVEVVSFSPQQMDFKSLHRIPEERITGVLGVPAILAGMGAGLESSSGRSESITLREFFTEGTVVPDWQRTAEQLTWSLLDTDYTRTSNMEVRFDFSRVRALTEDQNELWVRVDSAVRSGWITVAAAKRAVGLDPETGDDVYLRSVATEEVSDTVGVREVETAPVDV